MATEREYVGFGEWKPDLRYLANDDLLLADGVIPIYGDYISSPALTRITTVGDATTIPSGLHCHPQNGNSYVWLVDGANARIFQVTPAGVSTDVSRGALYTSPIPPFGGATGCSFGANVVMTNYIDAVQFQAGGAGAFANMITSAFAPQARCCFPLRGNLFLADLRLAAPFDTLPAGDNTTAVAWSQTENIRAYGSFNVTPELTGTGYQTLNYDIGDIRCALAGAGYGIIGHTDGITRVDGPPYTFRVVVPSLGCAFPYGACAVDRDIYYMSNAGLALLSGGEGPVRIVGAGKWIRSFIDNVTGFGPHPATVPALSTFGFTLEPFINLSMAHDPVNNLLFIAYTLSGDTEIARGLMTYNISEDRASFFQLVNPTPVAASILFLRNGRQGDVSTWGPGRDIRFLEGTAASGQQYLCKMVLGNSGSSAILQRGYMQFKTSNTTRLLRVRPVYTVTDQAAIEQISVTIESTNKPYKPPTTYGPFTGLDNHGWITTPTTAFADFHSIKFTVTANAAMHKLVEYQGFEYEIEIGAPYSA